MDPLSFAASLSAMAGVAFQLVSYVNSVKDGSEERKKLGNVLMSLWMALQQLQQQLLSDLGQEDQSWSRNLQILQEPGGIISQINDALAMLQSKLQSKTGGKKLLQSLRWPLDKADVDRATQQILQLHQLLTGVLTQTNISLARDIRNDGAVVKDLMVGEELQSFLGWLSPLNHPQRKQLIFQQACTGTGKWLLDDKTYGEWEHKIGSILWCPGIPGAGKSFLSSIVLDRLQALQKARTDKKIAVLMIYFAFDDANSQSSDLIMGSLLKQILQHRSDVPGDLRKEFRHHRNTGTRPTHDEICKALKSELAHFEQIYIVMDALDEVLDESKRRTLVENVMQLKENINLMVTSRPLESIHKIFGTLGRVWCDGCESQAAYKLGGLPYRSFFFHCANCDDEEGRSFDLCSNCYGKGVVSIASQHERHSFAKIYSSLTIEILARDEDIQSYIEWRIEGNESLRRSVDKKIGLREQILQKVIESARGMFLLAKFHMDSLITKLTPRAVVKALETLPTGTDTTYELAMQRINDMNPDYREKANLFLVWVAYTYRPLNVREIEHATTLLMDDTEIDTDEIIPAKILASMCAGLVIIDEMDNVRLCHYTVENYFKKVRSQFFPDSEVYLARTCLTYLLLDDFDVGRCPDREFEHRSKIYPFLGYAASHWGRHLQSTTNESAEQQGLLFLKKESHIEVAVQALWHGQLGDKPADQTWDAKLDATGLHLASYFGLIRLVESLIADHADLNAQDSAGTTALTYAAQEGHHSVVERLLVAGADPNLMGSQGGNALYRATLNNRVGIVKLLLAIERLDVNAQSRSSPLIVASEYGYTEIVQELLKRKDIWINDVRKMGLVGYTALHVAICYVELEVIKLLLADPRIEYERRDSSGNPPLILAAIRGEVAIVEMLLNAGADISQSDSELDGGGTAILRAIDYGHLAVVQLLYKRGADWQCLDRYNRSLVHGAAVNGQSAILRWLLQNQPGFDVNLQDINGKTALHDAAWAGYSDCIKVLLEFHARTDILNKVGKSPLRTAKERNHATSYELLKEARDQQIESAKRTNTLLSVIDVPLTTAALDGDIELVQEFIIKAKVDSSINLNETDDGLENNALSASIYGTHIEIAKMLIAAGINVNLQDRLGRAPIHISSSSNQYAMTKLLIESNADINLRDQWGRTALVMASASSLSRIVMLLLEHDAIIDQPGFDVQIWLFSAAYMGNQPATKRLLECGADAQRRDSLGRTPFQLAKLMGFEECAQLLLDFEETKK